MPYVAKVRRSKAKVYGSRKEWEKARQKVLQRDNSKCTRCGRTRDDGVKLHIHHIRHAARGGQTMTSNLTTLCEICHKAVHKH